MDPDYLEPEPVEAPSRGRGSRWTYFLAGAGCVLITVAVLQFVGILIAVAEFLTSLVFPVLCVAVLGWFAYWLLLSRRGIIGRRLHYRRMEARRHARWLRRAAENRKQK